MKFIQMGALALVFASSQVLAQNLNAGLEAYNAGNYEAALEEWRPLAEQGDAAAQFNLGLMYREGLDVPQDYALAVKWYRLSAEQGYAGAQNKLGYAYDKGQGVPQDYLTAHMWYNLASSNGSTKGGKNRDIVAATMTPAAIEEAQRRARECMGSDYQICY